MSRRVDDQETRDLVLLLAVLIHDSRLGLDGLDWEVCRADLLCDTSCFPFLHISLTDLDKSMYDQRLGDASAVEAHLVQQLRFTSIDVSKNTADRAAEVVLASSGKGRLVSFLPSDSGLCLLLSGHALRLGHTCVGVVV